jgi:iron complex outermembrane receptor protein
MKRFVVACLLSTALSAPAWGQTAGAAGGASASATAESNTGEIIVTAQKRSERLSDVPVSITAATGEQLAKAGVYAPSDLAKVVPGFSYRPSDYGTPVFYIRGVGFNDVAVAVAPAVSVYVDQVPYPFLVMTEGTAFDLERVEVLKGPQGTLFGQNSTGGAINFIAAKPTRELSAGADLTYGSYNENDIQGFVSGPISDSLTGRIAVRHEGRDGWQISETRPDDRLGSRDFTEGRVLLDWQASDKLKFEFNANGWIDKSETQAAQFVSLAITKPVSAGGYDELTDLIGATYTGPAPDNPRIADWGTVRPANLPSYIGQSDAQSLRRNDNFYQLSLHGDLQLAPDISLTSITAYSHVKTDAPDDPEGVEYNDFRITVRAKIDAVSQELRVAGKTGGLHWVAGANYAYDRSEDDQTGSLYGSNSGVGPLRFSSLHLENHQKVQTASAFGSLDYEIVPGLTAQGSARYTNFKDNFRGCLRDAGDGQLANSFDLLSDLLRTGFGDPTLASPQANAGPGQCVTFDTTTLLPVSIVTNRLKESNVSWRGGLQWKPVNDALVYGNITRGYKAGSFPTVPAISPIEFTPVTQESVTAYEVGIKLSALDRKLQLTGAGFYYQYKNKQIVGYIPSAFGQLPGLIQIPRSSIRGFELGVNYRPVHGLTLTGGATYIDAKVDSNFLANDPFANVINIKGEQFPVTPKWQLNGDIDYRFPISESLDLALGGDVRYQSGAPGAFGDSPEFKVPGYAVVDLRWGLEAPGGKWKLQFWGRNVGNKFYITSITHVTDIVARTTGIGATYGATLSFRY